MLVLDHPLNDQTAGSLELGGDLRVRRLGLGAMRLTGAGIWGEPADPEGAREVLVRAVGLGVNFIDTADSYGPEVRSEERRVGKSVDLGGRRIIKKKKKPKHQRQTQTDLLGQNKKYMVAQLHNA